MQTTDMIETKPKIVSQLGERLHQARESKGVSLAQAAAATRIIQPLLKALEEGSFELLPNSIVAKGFVRNYADFLGLSPEEMVELYRTERGYSNPIRVVPTTIMPKARSFVLPSFFGVFFVTLALVALTYVVLNAIHPLGESSLAAKTAAVPTLVVATPTALAAAPTSSPFPMGLNNPPAPGPSPLPQPSPTLSAPIVVDVSIKPDGGDSWLRVQADGIVVYERIMRAGEKEVFKAQRRVAIRSGNPTVVQVSVNGMQPEALGQVPGVPVNWTWPPQ